MPGTIESRHGARRASRNWLISVKAVGRFVDRHPAIKMLAFSFLILICVSLVGKGLDFHIPKGYIYFAMAFSVGVEILNIRVRRN